MSPWKFQNEEETYHTTIFCETFDHLIFCLYVDCLTSRALVILISLCREEGSSFCEGFMPECSAPKVSLDAASNEGICSLYVCYKNVKSRLRSDEREQKNKRERWSSMPINFLSCKAPPPGHDHERLVQPRALGRVTFFFFGAASPNRHEEASWLWVYRPTRDLACSIAKCPRESERTSV